MSVVVIKLMKGDLNHQANVLLNHFKYRGIEYKKRNALHLNITGNKVDIAAFYAGKDIYKHRDVYYLTEEERDKASALIGLGFDVNEYLYNLVKDLVNE